MHIESLESRNLFSPAPWPRAPFSDSVDAGTIYTNQFGKAFLGKQFFSSNQSFVGYAISSDDPGGIQVDTVGDIPADSALYKSPGPPKRVSRGSPDSSVYITAPEDKRTLYIAIRRRSRRRSDFKVQIRAPFASYDEVIRISSSENVGFSGSDISGPNDSDFYNFKLPAGGSWTIRAIPDPERHDHQLNATLNVYDRHGKPVGGSFLRAIDREGTGKVEAWTGRGLKRGARYYFRVGGAHGTLGGYGVSVIRNDPPTHRKLSRQVNAPAAPPPAPLSPFVISPQTQKKNPFAATPSLSLFT